MDRIYFGGNIVTMRAEDDTAEAVLVSDGIIKAVGKFSDLKKSENDNIEYINLEGKTMLPAFIDSHSHLTMLAQNMAKADLHNAKSFDDIVNILTEFREKNRLYNGEYIQGFGYDHNRLVEGRHPDKSILNKVSTDNPIYISHISFHMGVANSLALEQAGLNKDTELSEDLAGRLENGELSGYLAETGMIPIYRKIYETPIDLQNLYEKAQEVYIKNGICTIQDGALGKEQFEQIKALSVQTVLKVDVNVLLMMNDFGHETVENNRNLINSYENHLKISGYKLVLDGSPQGKTAWLSEPYTDGTNGTAWMTNEQVLYFANQAIEDGIQLNVHCNGDEASEQFLRNYEKAFYSSKNSEKKNLRPVMIHSQTVRYDQLERFSQLGIMPSFFVDHVYFWGDVHLKNLGEKRAENISPVGWAEELNLPYTFHQDSPVINPNMLRTIRTAVERTTITGALLGLNHRVSVYNALKAVTINAAYQYREENKKGSIEAGKYADFVILDRNPLDVPVSEITDIKIIETIFRDESLYKFNV